jgi:hypothetical protein
MLAGLNAEVNPVAEEEEEEEDGYVNVARADEQEKEIDSWWTPDDSWLEMEAVEEDEEGIFYVNIVNGEEDESGQVDEYGAREDCVCQGQPSSTDEEEEVTTIREVSVRRRLKWKRPSSEEAKWESIRKNAWLRELLTSSSEEEEEEPRRREPGQGRKSTSGSRSPAGGWRRSTPRAGGRWPSCQPGPAPPRRGSPAGARSQWVR